MANKKEINLDYPAILDVIKRTLVAGRTESHALLVWFLEHYFRLDELQSQEAVCDGRDDKGIDAIYVDENLETVFVFQCKLVQKPDRTLGDTQLKEFVGTLDQFGTAENIREIARTTSNIELARLLEAQNVAQLVNDGYEVKGVFVTNAARDGNAETYLKDRPNLDLFDKLRLIENYIPTGPTEPVGKPVTFDMFGFDYATHQIEDITRAIALGQHERA